MDEANGLEQIANEMDAILSRFQRDRHSIHIANGDQAKFTGLVLQARTAMNRGLGPAEATPFVLALERTRQEGVNNFTGSQSYHSVEEATGIVRAAVNSIRSQAARPSNIAAGTPAALPYVNLALIEQLRSVQSSLWDLSRLVRMCEELNSVFAAGNCHATVMLLRAILDHVSPIFGAPNFGQFAATTGRSLKASMERLDKTSRDIADRWLHQQIRKSESLPTTTQVDFRQELDALLGEVVGTLR
jgi:hypothetical protein